MSFFFRWSLVYFLVAALIGTVLRDNPFYAGFKLLYRGDDWIRMFGVGFPITIALTIGLVVTSDTWREVARRLGVGALALLTCSIFLGAFSSVKTTLPLMADALGLAHFFADPFFAELDRALHGGTDPWIWTHDFVRWTGIENFADHAGYVYGLWWTIPAFYLPVIMILLGERGARFRHYILLYFFAWIVLGNVLALAGLSAGPIYYDRIFATEEYADLHVSLAAQGLSDSWFGQVQPRLWEAYEGTLQAVGSGISAFPSLHVGMVVVAALYLSGKAWWLGIVGWGLAAMVMFISVWSGYHYAIDGYFSIAAVLAVHVMLKRRQIASDQTSDAPSQLTLVGPAE